MVHQLCLISTIEFSNYIQTISTLQAITGQVPTSISTYSIISKPINVFKPKFEPGKVNQIEQFFMKSITTWDEDININDPIIDKQFTSKLFTGENKIWTLQIADIPIAGKNQICSLQNIYESTLVYNSNDNSFLQFLNDLGYEVINQFWNKGLRFFYGDIVIEIYKIFIRDDGQQEENPDDMEGIQKSDKITLKLLDESNGFQIKAFINVPKSTDLDIINQGYKDLVKLQDNLKGLVKFEIPDRIFMDSRVSST